MLYNKVYLYFLLVVSNNKLKKYIQTDTCISRFVVANRNINILNYTASCTSLIKEISSTSRNSDTEMSASYGHQHSNALYVSPLSAINADSSSDEDETFTLEEGIMIWYEKKTRATQFAYNQYVKHFRTWLKAAHGRDIDHRLKQKHVKLHLIEKAKSSQMRPVISVLKSLFKHLKKYDVIKRDILLTFDNVKR